MFLIVQLLYEMSDYGWIWSEIVQMYGKKVVLSGGGGGGSSSPRHSQKLASMYVCE